MQPGQSVLINILYGFSYFHTFRVLLILRLHLRMKRQPPVFLTGGCFIAQAVLEILPLRGARPLRKAGDESLSSVRLHFHPVISVKQAKAITVLSI
jgi:hypothetical protein